ncbi:hypothetical protein C3408_12025 [Candidatus Pantoea alvi]|nr:hypothetical protein C3408_12025 [Pantoea alvi]
MLENYFFSKSGFETDESQKRERAVSAALEIARASAAATTQRARGDKVEDDLKFAAQGIAALADAIQNALEPKKV